MDKKLLRKALVAGGLLFFLNIVFIYIDLYWIIPWLDIPMHYLGGMLVACIPLYFAFPKHKLYARRAAVILSVLSISIIWEWYESVLGFSKPLALSLYDTVIDTGAALLGGVSAYLALTKK